MAFPVDVQLVTVTCGSGSDFFGDNVTITATVSPVLGGNLKRIIHAASGTFLARAGQTFTGEPGQPLTFAVPNPFQADTWLDGAGNSYIGWAYTVSISVTTESRERLTWVQAFQPVAGQTNIDLDLVPDGTVGSPMSAPVPAVTDVNGKTGSVVIPEPEPLTPELVEENLTAEAVEAKLPERLSETALSAAIDESIAVSPYIPFAPVASAGIFDSRFSLYNYKAKHFKKIGARLATAEVGTNSARIYCVGSSIAAGQGAIVGAEDFPTVLRDLFVGAGIPKGGSGVVLCSHADSSADPRWSFTSAWSHFVNGLDRTILYKGGTGAKATFAPPEAGTIVTLYYSHLGPTFTVAIDGGTAVTVTPNGTSNIGVYQVTGLADTPHTMVVTLSGTTYLVGAEVARTAGIQVSNIGLGGARARDIDCLDAQFGAKQFVANRFPDLVTLNVMTNDTNTSISAADYKVSVKSCVTSFRNGTSDVLLIAEIPANGQDFTAHRQALYEVADEMDLPLLDMYSRWDSYANANTRGLMLDAFHPRKAGYRDYGRALYNVIHA